MATTKNFIDVIREKLKTHPDLADSVEDARFAASIADAIFNARSQQGKTQAELGALIGMNQSAIARMEDADYGRHSITSLRRVASALGKRLEVRFTDTYTTMAWPHHIDMEIEKPIAWSHPMSEWNQLSHQLSKSLADPITYKIS